MNRHSLLSMVIGVAVCALPTITLADTLPSAIIPASTQTTIPSTIIPVSDSISAFMEVFLVNLKVKYFDQAYKSTTESFRKNMTFTQFKKMVIATRLVDFESKKWISNETKTAGVDMVTGEFTSGGLTRLVTFALVKKDSSYTIHSITETLNPELLLALFPKDAALQSLIIKDLALIGKTITYRSYIKFYRTMAKSTQRAIKFKDFKKSLMAFRQENHDLTIPNGSTISFNDGYPKITPESTISVKGHYINSSKDVQFELTYEYIWEWKLSGLNMNPVAIEMKK